MIKNFGILLLFISFFELRPQIQKGPFTLDEYTGPFKPQEIKYDPQRFLTEFVYPFPEDVIEEQQDNRFIEINLEDTSLAEIASFIENAFNVKFIYEDTVSSAAPAVSGSTSSPSLEAIKINFKTNKKLTKVGLWNLFLSFMDIAGKMVSPGPEPRVYLVGSTLPVNDGIRVPLPTYLGTNPSELPDNDMKIRYLYFVRNTSLTTIFNVINSIKSAGSPKVEQFEDVNGILITEKAANIKAMMAIIQEIDRAAMPEAMSILKLKRADAATVAALYTELIGAQPQAGAYGRPRKAPTGSYFPPNMRVIAEPRTNTLILIGTPEAIHKVEDFIKEHVDRELEKPFSPLHTYYLKFADATTVASYLNELVAGQAKIDPVAASYGGVRDGDKLLGPMRFVAEVKTNMILILGDYDDYLKVYDLLQQIDVEQPQVILRVLILTVDLTDAKVLGTQLRSKVNIDDNCKPNTAIAPSLRDALGKNTTWQTSGVGPIIERETGTGATRLLGDLINLVVGQPAGTTAVTLGKDAFGIWGFLRILDAHTKVNVVDSPFLVATHKTRAQIISGETRRVQESQVFGGSSNQGNGFTDLAANLEVGVTPLISSDGLITLDIEIHDDEFTGVSGSDISSGNRVTRVVNTETSVFDKEVLAIGGIVRSRVEDSMQKVPILGDIPILGWLFKNKTQSITKNSLIILISPEIITTHNDDPMNDFTAERLTDIEETFCQLDHLYQQRDPAHRWFFNDTTINEHAMIDAFLPGEPSTYSHEGKALTQKREERKAQLVDQFQRTTRASVLPPPTPELPPIPGSPIVRPPVPDHAPVIPVVPPLAPDYAPPGTPVVPPPTLDLPPVPSVPVIPPTPEFPPATRIPGVPPRPPAPLGTDTEQFPVAQYPVNQPALQEEVPAAIPVNDGEEIIQYDEVTGNNENGSYVATDPDFTQEFFESSEEVELQSTHATPSIKKRSRKKLSEVFGGRND